MAKTRVQKQETVKKLAEKLANAKALVFADYKGLTMKQLLDLRNSLTEQQAEFIVTKNTLLERALGENKIIVDNSTVKRKSTKADTMELSKIEGPTATLFAYDEEISPIKLLVKALKEAGVGKVKGGFLGSQFFDEARVLQLANIPTKDELRAKTVAVLVAPLQGMVGVLQGNLRNLVYTLNQIRLQKGGV